jgi:polyhydroxybutyrate depolymerase
MQCKASAETKIDGHVWLRPEYLLASLICLVWPIASVRAQETQEKVDVNDVSRSYVVHLPQGYDQKQHYPVVIVLHGQNQDPDDIARLTHFSQFAEKNGVISVYPAATRGQWNIGVRPEVSDMMERRPFGRRGGMGGGGYPGGGYPGGGGGYPGGGQRGGQTPDETRNRPEPADDVAFLNEMLDSLALKFSVDTHRIYAAGLGDGGFMALRAGCTMADRIAAVAAVGADLPKTMICLPSRAVSALFVDGTDDPVIPYSGGNYKPGRFHVLSAEESAKTWAKFDRCEEKPVQGKLPPLDKNKDKGAKETKTLTYNGCQDNAQVTLYAVKNAGNTWPGGEQYMSEKEVGKVSNAISANEAIWSFFSTKKISGDTAGQKQ